MQTSPLFWCYKKQQQTREGGRLAESAFAESNREQIPDNPSGQEMRETVQERMFFKAEGGQGG